MALQEFTPDDAYCVYCHAVAAGPCAECAALCCGDCVEVVVQLATPRAICRACLAERPPSRWARLRAWLRRRRAG